jgi:acetyl esterase/lipase
MPTLFLIVTIVGALLTLNAWHPNRSHPRWSALSFFFGWLTSELAMHHVIWEVAATLVFISLGALSAWPGWLGLGIACANWFALLADYLSGWRARPIVQAALDEAFGNGWRSSVRPELLEKITRVSFRQLLFPLPVSHPEVEKAANVCFDRTQKKPLCLDVYRHKAHPTNTPTFIYVHGGAWVIGDKSTQGLPILQHMASLGWTCFGVNYRLSPRATFPDHLIDVKRAIAWVKENGAQYGANANFIVISGGSAGGHLAALAALTAEEKVYQPGFEQADCHVNACVCSYGVFDFTDRAKAWPHLGMIKLVAKYVMKSRIATAPEDWRKASPIAWVTKSAPPFMLTHGTRDSLVPMAESRNFADALRAVSDSPVAFAAIPGAQHAFEIFPSPRAVCAIEGIADFSTVVYSRYLGSPQ